MTSEQVNLPDIIIDEESADPSLHWPAQSPDIISSINPNPLDEKWMLNALCRSMDPNIFYPSDGVGVDKAKAICSDCKVAEACLEYAIARGDDKGVWGGTSERERRRMMRSRGVTPIDKL